MKGAKDPCFFLRLESSFLGSLSLKGGKGGG